MAARLSCRRSRGTPDAARVRRRRHPARRQPAPPRLTGTANTGAARPMALIDHVPPETPRQEGSAARNARSACPGTADETSCKAPNATNRSAKPRRSRHAHDAAPSRGQDHDDAWPAGPSSRAGRTRLEAPAPGAVSVGVVQSMSTSGKVVSRLQAQCVPRIDRCLPPRSPRARARSPLRRRGLRPAVKSARAVLPASARPTPPRRAASSATPSVTAPGGETRHAGAPPDERARLIVLGCPSSESAPVRPGRTPARACHSSDAGRSARRAETRRGALWPTETRSPNPSTVLEDRGGRDQCDGAEEGRQDRQRQRVGHGRCSRRSRPHQSGRATHVRTRCRPDIPADAAGCWSGRSRGGQARS